MGLQSALSEATHPIAPDRKGPHAIAIETVTEVEAAPENQELHPIAVLIGRL